MSIDSSVPEPGAGPARGRVAFFRWKAIGPLLLLLAFVALLVWLFAEPVAHGTTEEASTELLGTQVDVGTLDIDADEVSVDLTRLEVADPFDPMRNLVEAADIRIRLDPEALTEKKFVIEQLTLSGMRFGTARRTPATQVDSSGYAGQLLGQMRGWAQQFDVPLLSLTPIDTIRQLVLDPTQLSTIREARALAARTDSTRRALETGYRGLAIEATIDTAEALVRRVRGTDVRRLGIDGTRRAVEDVRRSLREIAAARERVEALERNVRSGVATLQSGITSVDEARRADYAFARGLLQLPTFAAPEIGKALFGDVSIDRFQQAVYWAELAQRYMPPGLLPRETSGPQRLRASGTTVAFPKERNYPKFLLENGRIDLAVDEDNALRGSYEATVQGLTSSPELYGRPAFISARRDAPGSSLPSIRVDAVLDHRGTPIRDSAVALLERVQLPTFPLPGTPFEVDAGRGTTSLAVALRGDRIRARWTVASREVAWQADSAGRALNQLERVVWRVLSGLDDLRVTAELTGDIRSPALAVSSNLDDAIANRLEAVVGEEVAKAERRVRAEVDRLVQEHVEPVRRQADAVRTEATERIARERARLDDVETQLEAELERLASPVRDRLPIPIPKLPL